MSATNRMISIGIAGLGVPGLLASYPYRLRLFDATAGGYVGNTVRTAVILRDHPGGLGSTLEMDECWIAQGTLEFSAHCLDTDEGGLALKDWAWQANPDFVAVLAMAVTIGQTNWTVTHLGYQTIPTPPFNFYIGRECCVCTAIAGAAPGPYTWTVARGQYGTVAREYSNPIIDDVRIYPHNTIVETREVSVYEYDHATDTETLIWLGMIDSVDLEEGLTSLRFHCSDVFSMLAQRKLGDGRAKGTGWIQTDIQGDTVVPGLGTTIDVLDMSSSKPQDDGAALFCRDAGDRQILPMTDGTTVIAPEVFQVQDGRQSLSVYYASTAGVYREGYPTLYGTPPGQSSRTEGEAEELLELLVADAGPETATVGLVRDENGIRSDHPFTILLNILTSSGSSTWPSAGVHLVGNNGAYDWLPRHWGLNIPAGLIDIAGIEALRDSAIFRRVRARNFVVGFEDEVTVKEVMVALLNPLFVVPSITSTGQLSLTSLIPTGTTLATITAADLADRIIASQPWSSMTRVKSIALKMARIGVGDKYGHTITDLRVSGVLQDRYPFGATALEIDGGHYGHPVHHDGSDVTLENVLTACAETRWKIQVNRLVEHEIRVNAEVPKLHAGALCEVSIPAVLGEDAQRGVTEHLCLVLEATPDPSDWTQKLHLLDLWSVARAANNVAPAWRIESWVSSTPTVLTIFVDEFTADDTATWKNDADGTYRVQICDKTGLELSAWYLEGTIVGNTITFTGGLGGDFPDGKGGIVVPVQGDLLLVEPYSGGDWLAVEECAYFAGPTGRFVPDAPAHRWYF